MVADPQTEIRSLFEYLGLAFEERCLRFYETERAVRTASSEQVRMPIFADALEQWKHYERWLDPLRDALEPALTAYADALRNTNERVHGKVRTKSIQLTKVDSDRGHIYSIVANDSLPKGFG